MWVQKVSGGGVMAVAYAPDGGTLYTYDRSGWVTAWDTAARRGRRLPVNCGGASYWHVPTLSVLADGRLLTVAGAIVTWDTTTGKERSRVERPELLLAQQWRNRVYPGGRIYSVHQTQTAIAGWNVTTGEPEPLLTSSAFATTVCVFDLSSDGKRVVFSYGGGPTVLFERGAGPELQNPIKLPALDGSATRAQFAPDGRTLAFATNQTSRKVPEAILWDVRAGRPRADRVRCWTGSDVFAFNPVFPLFAGLGPEGVLTLFNLESGEPIRSLDFALGRRVRCVTFSPDGLTCAVGGSNKQFAVFDVDL
jgi:WD40 repeat protein